MREGFPDKNFMTSHNNFSGCHFWVFLNQGLCPIDVFCSNGRCHSTTTVIAFHRSCARHGLSELPEYGGFGQRLISKTVFQTLKALFIRFSLAVVITHYRWKSTSGKSSTAGREPPPLLDTLSHAIETVVRN